MTVERGPSRCVYIISGIPGAAKTTVARALARRLRFAAHDTADLTVEETVDLILREAEHRRDILVAP